MANETPNIDPNEEEYHFTPDSETTNVYATDQGETAKTGVFERIKRKNVLIAIGVIVVMLSVYKLLDVLLTEPARPRTPIPAVAPIPAFPTEARPTTEPPAPIATATPATPEPAPISPALNERLTNLEQQNASLSSQMTDMQTAMSNLSAQLATVNETVQNLASQLAQQQAAAEAAKHRAIVVRHARPRPKPIYFVRAMIPGRAWLVTGCGTTVTVSLGDDLPGYGTVEIIDPLQGTITTSAGAIIGYRANDR